MTRPTLPGAKKDRSLVVNEPAPGPHHTFRTTGTACLTSQFEQGVRAVALVRRPKGLLTR